MQQLLRPGPNQQALPMSLCQRIVWLNHHYMNVYFNFVCHISGAEPGAI